MDSLWICSPKIIWNMIWIPDASFWYVNQGKWMEHLGMRRIGLLERYSPWESCIWSQSAALRRSLQCTAFKNHMNCWFLKTGRNQPLLFLSYTYIHIVIFWFSKIMVFKNSYTIVIFFLRTSTGGSLEKKWLRVTKNPGIAVAVHR